MSSPARAASAILGAACVLVGLVSLPLPLFPSLLFVLLGAALIARSSWRVRRWLFAQPWFAHTRARIKSERAQRWLAQLLGTA